jgi:hypothetical protein
MPKKIKQSNKQKQSQNVIVHVHNEKKHIEKHVAKKQNKDYHFNKSHQIFIKQYYIFLLFTVQNH